MTIHCLGTAVANHSGKGLDTITVTGNVLRFWTRRSWHWMATEYGSPHLLIFRYIKMVNTHILVHPFINDINGWTFTHHHWYKWWTTNLVHPIYGYDPRRKGADHQGLLHEPMGPPGGISRNLMVHQCFSRFKWLVWRIYPSFYMGVLKFVWVPQNHGCQY